MELRYIGPYDAVDTEDGQTVRRGQVGDFDPELGERLTEQVGAWCDPFADPYAVDEPEPDEPAEDLVDEDPLSPIEGEDRAGKPLDADADGVMDAFETPDETPDTDETPEA